MSSIPTPSPNRQTTQAVSTPRSQPARQNPLQLAQRYGTNACYIIRSENGGYEFGGSIAGLTIMRQELRNWTADFTANGGSTNPGFVGTTSGRTTTTLRKPMSQAARAKLSAAAIARAQARRATASAGTEGHTEPVRGTRKQRAMAAGN